MNSAKHTPGPWTLCNDGHETQSTFLIGTNENPDVARVYDITKEAPANAKLIAAAPDLLDALETARKHLIDQKYTKECAVIQMIDQAITNATE